MLLGALNRNRSIYTGDISTAFLHADVIKEMLIKPPNDFTPAITVPRGDQIIWKLLFSAATCAADCATQESVRSQDKPRPRSEPTQGQWVALPARHSAGSAGSPDRS